MFFPVKMSDESALLHCGNTARKTEKQYYYSVYVYAAATDDDDGERSEMIITDFGVRKDQAHSV